MGIDIGIDLKLRRRPAVNRMTDWTLKRQWGLLIFSVATFPVLLYYEKTRIEAIIGVWSAILLGLVVAVLVTSGSEDVIRRKTLQDYPYFAKWIIEPILNNAVKTAQVAFDLPQTIVRNLAQGNSRAVRHRAYEAAWEHIEKKEPGAEAVVLVDDKPAADLVRDMLRYREAIKKETETGRVLLDRIISVQWPLYLYFHASNGLADVPDDATRRSAWDPLLPTGAYALNLCEACSEVLMEAGRLRSR